MSGAPVPEWIMIEFPVNDKRHPSFHEQVDHRISILFSVILAFPSLSAHLPSFQYAKIFLVVQSIRDNGDS